jgi:hypothetical protein
MSTSALTVRNLEADIKSELVKYAKEHSWSINTAALQVFREKFRPHKARTTPHSDKPWYEEFRGIMGSDGINQDVLDDFNKIDPEMWK